MKVNLKRNKLFLQVDGEVKRFDKGEHDFDDATAKRLINAGFAEEVELIELTDEADEVDEVDEVEPPKEDGKKAKK